MKIRVCCLVMVLIGLITISAMATPINSAASFSGTFLQIEVSSGQTTASGPDPRVEAGRLKAGGIHPYDATDVKIVSSIPHTLTLNSTGFLHSDGFDGRTGFDYFNANRSAGEAAGFPMTARVIFLPDLAVILLFGLALLGAGVMVRRKKSRAMLRIDRHPDVINTRQVTWPESIPQHIEAPPNMEAK